MSDDPTVAMTLLILAQAQYIFPSKGIELMPLLGPKFRAFNSVAGKNELICRDATALCTPGSRVQCWWGTSGAYKEILFPEFFFRILQTTLQAP